MQQLDIAITITHSDEVQNLDASWSTGLLVLRREVAHKCVGGCGHLLNAYERVLAN